jgi:hypothetical protein
LRKHHSPLAHWRLPLSIPWALCACLVLIACGGPRQAAPIERVQAAALADTPASPGAAIPMQGPSHVFVIVMENKEDTDVLGNEDAPYLNQLVGQAAVADQYYAIRHPSLPNYLAMVSGHTFGIDSDCTDCMQDAPNLADAIEAKGLTWKSYQEDMPQPCYLGAQADGLYALKHDPFLYFNDIRNDPARCNRNVPLARFEDDIEAGAVPNFSFITPNLFNDSHDGSIADGDHWLASFVPQILASDAWKQNGALVITWDEGATDRGCCDVASGGQVPLLVLTPNGPAGYHATTPATHYSLLRTVEDLWGLDYLGHSGDEDVTSLDDLFVSQPS